MPTIEVDFHPDARAEYLDAIAWYVDRSETAARAFQHEVAHAIELILGAPARWPVIEADVRSIRLHRFPYVLYYDQPTSNRVQILAVAHGRRRPGYWRYRRMP